MEIKCIAMDLDGTALYDDRHMSERTQNAIREAVLQGIQVVVASGRCFSSLPQIVLDLDGIEYAITSNGASIYHLPEKQCIKKFSIPEKAVETILELTKELSCTFEVFFEGDAYAEESYIENPCRYGVSAKMIEYIQTTRKSVPDIVDFILGHKMELDSIDIMLIETEEASWVMENLRNMEDEIYFTPTLHNRIEIASWEAGKHRGLQYVLERIGVSAEKTAAFGDADNDIEMLQSVRYGMAVQNAAQNCLAAAWKVVPENVEDGVAIAIEEFLNE